MTLHAQGPKLTYIDGYRTTSVLPHRTVEVSTANADQSNLTVIHREVMKTRHGDTVKPVMATP